jgi:hypothetical protein
MPQDMGSARGSLSAAALAAALAAAALAVTACGANSSGDSSAPGTGTTAATSVTAATTVPPATTSAPATPSSSATAVVSSTPTPTSDTAAAPPACATSSLKVTLGSGGAAAGTAFTVIDFTNIGSAPCTLYGYPGASLTDAAGAQVGAAAFRNSVRPVTLVTLAGGATANATFGVGTALDYPTSKCQPAPVTGLKIYPPNQTESVVLPFKTTGCKDPAVSLTTITAVAPGTGPTVG